MGNKTNIPTGFSTADNNRRVYVHDKEDSYVDIAKTITDKTVYDRIVSKHSEFKKPYLAASYPEMEYKYGPYRYPYQTYEFEFPEIEIPEIEEIPILQTIYSGIGDGTVWEAQYNWDTVHDKLVGYGANSPTVQLRCSWVNTTVKLFTIQRAFLDFDLTAGFEFESVRLKLYYGSAVGNRTWVVQLGTHTPPILHSSDPGAYPVGQDPNFDEFTGAAFATRTFSSASGVAVFEFNQIGINYIRGRVGAGTALLCVRDYTYDFLDIEPAPIYPTVINHAGQMLSESSVLEFS